MGKTPFGKRGRGPVALVLSLVLLSMAGCAAEGQRQGKSVLNVPRDRVAVFDNRRGVEPLSVRADGYFDLQPDGLMLHLDALAAEHNPAFSKAVSVTAIAIRLQMERGRNWTYNWRLLRWSDYLLVPRALRSRDGALDLADLEFWVPFQPHRDTRYRLDLVFLDGEVLVGVAYGPTFFGRLIGKEQSAAIR